MPLEVERKFLVAGNAWRAETTASARIRQGYLVANAHLTVRIRTKDDAAFITVKGETRGIARAEYEYAIPLAEANEMLEALCQPPLVEKRRHTVVYAGVIWEVDEFFAQNVPLVLAELEREDAADIIDLPPWIGQEVTGDARYTNSNLARQPYSTW